MLFTRMKHIESNYFYVSALKLSILSQLSFYDEGIISNSCSVGQKKTATTTSHVGVKDDRSGTRLESIQWGINKEGKEKNKCYRLVDMNQRF